MLQITLAWPASWTVDGALRVIGALGMVLGAMFAGLAWWNARQAAKRIKVTHELVEKVAAPELIGNGRESSGG